MVINQPDYSDAWSNLAEVCKVQGQLNEAMTALCRALACPGSQRPVHDNLLLMLHYLPGQSRADLTAEHRRHGERYPARQGNAKSR